LHTKRIKNANESKKIGAAARIKEKKRKAALKCCTFRVATKRKHKKWSRIHMSKVGNDINLGLAGREPASPASIANDALEAMDTGRSRNSSRSSRDSQSSSESEESDGSEHKTDVLPLVSRMAVSRVPERWPLSRKRKRAVASVALSQWLKPSDRQSSNVQVETKTSIPFFKTPALSKLDSKATIQLRKRARGVSPVAHIAKPENKTSPVFNGSIVGQTSAPKSAKRLLHNVSLPSIGDCNNIGSAHTDARVLTESASTAERAHAFQVQCATWCQRVTEAADKYRRDITIWAEDCTKATRERQERQQTLINRLLASMECIVCLQPFNEDVAFGKCGHLTCKDCHSKLHTCPLCQAPIKHDGSTVQLFGIGEVFKGIHALVEHLGVPPVPRKPPPIMHCDAQLPNEGSAALPLAPSAGCKGSIPQKAVRGNVVSSVTAQALDGIVSRIREQVEKARERKDGTVHVSLRWADYVKASRRIWEAPLIASLAEQGMTAKLGKGQPGQRLRLDVTATLPLPLAMPTEGLCA
jgi:hypothetical protein